jgi:hypothetical protein
MPPRARNKGDFAVQTKKMLRHFAGARAWDHADTAW